MKYLFVLLFACSFSLASGQNNKTNNKDRDQFTVQVDGLGCPFCAYGLEKKFKPLKGIKQIQIDMETGIFTFSLPADEKLSLEAVIQRVDQAGYTAVSVSIARADGQTEKTEDSNPADMAWGELTSTKFFVAGNCGMCEARIEQAAKGIKGVKDASWNKKTKMLNLDYDASFTSPEAVEKAIATSGHDTKNQQAKDETYSELPGCCKYKRNDK